MEIIKRIESATDNSIMPLIYMCLNDSMIAVSWNNHDMKRGVASIDLEYHQKLRIAAIEKLALLGVPNDQLQRWYDAYKKRFEAFGIFERHIKEQIFNGTMSKGRRLRLFHKNEEIFNTELNAIADEYSDIDCELARKAGLEMAMPTYRGKHLAPINMPFGPEKYN